jgi:hypothetical protein
MPFYTQNDDHFTKTGSGQTYTEREHSKKVVGCFLRGKSLSVGELEELVDLFERSHAQLKWLQVRAEIHL